MSKYIFNNDTDILEFLEQLRENGIQIWGEGEKIRYRSKNRQLAPETLRILKMAKGQILDFFRMIEKNVIPLTSIQTAYVVGQTAGCELGNINAHYYIEYTIESLDVERLEQMINLVISKNDALRLIVTHEGKASFLDNVPYYSVPVYSLYDGNDREQKRLERSHHRYNYYKWPMFHFCVGKTSGKTSVLHVDFDCIILDAWSAKLLLNEIFSLYYGKDVKFPRISFMNYMRLKTDKGDLEAEEYWKEKVKNMPSFPKLNYQKKFAEVQNVRFDRIECDFSFIETQRLYQKIKNYHFTPAAVISTIFMKTLAQYSETPGLSINVTLFNRQLLHEDVNGILGEFTNNAVISYQEKTDSLLDAIRATQEQMWRLVQYRKFEGSNILKMLSSGRAGKAIMPVVFTCMLEGNVSNGKIDRKGLAESIQKNIKVKHNAKATLISQKKEYVELAKSIKKIVCSISGNDYIDYEDNLLENGLDSLLLSQISGRIVSDIQEAQGMRFDEILRASLTMPTIMGIAQYISDCKNPSKNQMHSNAGNQTRNSYTVVYIFGDNENEIRDVLIEKLSASNISCKRVGGQEIIERCHEDISVKKKYIIAFSEMASLCITKASELLGENIIINRIFLINPSKAKESDLYLGDISIIDGNSVAIKSWEKAVLGNVREFESNSNDIFDIIMRELENDK